MLIESSIPIKYLFLVYIFNLHRFLRTALHRSPIYLNTPTPFQQGIDK